MGQRCRRMEDQKPWPAFAFKKAFRSEIFLPGFISKIFDKFNDVLHQIWAFYDFPFPRYNKLDFSLERHFRHRSFARVANCKQNVKKLLHISYPQ